MTKNRTRRAVGAAWWWVPFLLACHGCRSAIHDSALPVRHRLQRESLLVHSNFKVPRRHRLLGEIVDLRARLSHLLSVPMSDEPIEVYLFDDASGFRNFLRARFPELSDRRAVFVRTDSRFEIFAHWSENLAEDLRHEATHAYLHCVFPAIPLWLDEGLAEYCETETSEEGLHVAHVELLVTEFRNRQWSPNLHRLEQITRPQDLEQIDYAEAWLWTHFLLNHSRESRILLTEALDVVRATGEASQIVATVIQQYPDAGGMALDHLQNLIADRTRPR